MKFLKRLGYIYIYIYIIDYVYCIVFVCWTKIFLSTEYKNSYNDILLFTTVVFTAGLMTNNKWD